MKKIGIIVGKNKDIDYKVTSQITEKLLQKGFEVAVTPEVKAGLSFDVIESDSVCKDSDFIICVG